jgi:hypothetical protein
MPKGLLEDFTGQTFGELKIEEILQERNHEGRRLCRCRCVHPGEDGIECGHEFTTLLKSVTSGRAKTCGHHRPGRAKDTVAKFPTVMRENGIAYYLPEHARQLLGIGRRRMGKLMEWNQYLGRPMDRCAFDIYREGQVEVVKYVSRADVNETLLKMNRTPDAPPGCTLLTEKLANGLGFESAARIREIARGDKLPAGYVLPDGDKIVRAWGRDKKKRLAMRSYIAQIFIDWLQDYKAEHEWKDAKTGLIYVTIRAFCSLAKMREQNVYFYREKGNHSALGRRIRFVKAPLELSRSNRHEENYLYSKDDAIQIGKWKDARNGLVQVQTNRADAANERTLTESSDGTSPPDNIRLREKTYTGLRPLEWKLVDFIWNKGAVRVGAAIECLYGHDADGKENAFNSVVKRVRNFFLSKSFPGEIRVKGGFVELQLFNS